MVLQACPQRDDDGHKRRQTSLQAPWRADADERPHQEGEVEAADVHEEPFQDVRVAAQMDAPHATGFVEMRVRSFQPLAAAPLQRPPTHAADTPPVRVHRGARRRLLRPVPPPTIGLGNVSAQVERRQVQEYLITVVPLVGDDLVDDRGVFVRHGGHGFQLFGGRGHRLRDGRGVALVGTLHRDTHDRAGLQVDRVLGLVCEMGPPVFHFRDARVGVVWMPPLGVAAFLGAFAIEARQIRPRRRLDARGLREPRQKLLIRLAGVAAHDAP